MRRREFITLVGSAATTWVRYAHSQSSLPVIGFIDAGSTKRNPELMAAFIRGLTENGFVVDRNVTIESRSSGGDERMLSGVVNDLIRRNVAVITTPAGAAATMAAKAATTSIPIAFLVAIDPVASGLVTSLSHPGGNLTAGRGFSTPTSMRAALD